MKRKLLLTTLFMSLIMLISMSAVFAEEETYTVKYETYADEYVFVTPKTVHWDDTGLNYKGEGSGSYYVPIEEEYEDMDMEFMGWYTDPTFQTRCTDQTKYSDIAKDPSVKEVTLYAWIKHEHHGVKYTPWGYTDRLPDKAGNWYLMQDVHLKNYVRGDTAAWTAPAGNTNLCLNDYGIYRDSRSDDDGDISCSVIEVPEDADLTITSDYNDKSNISGGNAGTGKGGGVVVRGKFSMLNGTVRDNTAADGGGIAVLGSGELDLFFCNITGNKVPEGGNGGGVYLDSTATLHLGSDSASTPKISGNKAGNAASDLSIDGGESWNKIEVGGLSGNSRIGIETRNLPSDFEAGITVTSGLGETTVTPFSSNDPRLKIETAGEGESREVVLKHTKNTVTFMAGDETFDVQTVYGGEKAVRPETDPTREGSAFKEWLYNDKPYDFDEPVLGDMTLIARFDSDHYHEGKMFSAWTAEDSLPTESGGYYLTKDVTLTSTYKLDNTVDIHICLNGHTVTKANGGMLIDLEPSNNRATHFSLYDCSNGKTGKLTGASGDLGAVEVRGSGAVFTMNGGVITGNTTSGIDIRYRGTAVINDGTISDNTVDQTGDIYNANAGGVKITTDATLKMNGGQITGNKGAGIVMYSGVLELSGGQITGNTIDPDEDGDTDLPGGAGIYAFYDSTIRFKGTDRITITDNECAGEVSNVYLDDDDGDLLLGFGDDCAMDESSLIGVTMALKPTEEKPVVFTGGLGEHASVSSFFSDDGEYQVRKNNDGEAELYYDPIDIKLSFDANGGSGEMADVIAKYNQKYELPECDFTPATGYEFDGWLIADKKYDEKEEVQLKKDTVIKAGWKPVKYSIEYDLAGGSEEAGKENPVEYTVESDDITLENPVRPDYMFKGWTSSDITEPEMEITIPAGSIGDRKYTANWTPVIYTIEYFLNDGLLPEGQRNPYTYTVESDDITLVNPVKEDSTFKGWYLVGVDGEPKATMVLPKGSSGNKTFIAVFGVPDHDHGMTKVDAVPVTCEQAGSIEYYVCDQGPDACGGTFADEAGTKPVKPAKAVDEGGVIIPAPGHDFSEPTYTWADDNSKVTAARTCKACGKAEEETVGVTSKVTKQPTETKDGELTYTSDTFENPAFAVQTKTEVIPKKGYAPGADPNQKGTDGTAVGPGASAAAADKAITTMKSDKDPKGSVFAKLRFKSSKQTKSSVKLAWSKVAKAKKYVIYGNKCSAKNKPVKLAQVTGSSKTFKKVAGKKVKKGTYYKFILVALDKDNNVVSTSKLIHVATKGGKAGNHKSVTVTKKIAAKAKALKTGKALALKAKAVPQSKKLKVKKHVALRYETTNAKVATVNAKGTIKAKAKGTCYVYAYAQNGVTKKVKVVVK